MQVFFNLDQLNEQNSRIKKSYHKSVFTSIVLFKDLPLSIKMRRVQSYQSSDILLRCYLKISQCVSARYVCLPHLDFRFVHLYPPLFIYAREYPIYTLDRSFTPLFRIYIEISRIRQEISRCVTHRSSSISTQGENK